MDLVAWSFMRHSPSLAHHVQNTDLIPSGLHFEAFYRLGTLQNVYIFAPPKHILVLDKYHPAVHNTILGWPWNLMHTSSNYRHDRLWYTSSACFSIRACKDNNIARANYTDGDGANTPTWSMVLCQHVNKWVGDCFADSFRFSLK